MRSLSTPKVTKKIKLDSKSKVHWRTWVNHEIFFTVIYTLKSESTLIKFWLSRPIAPHEQFFVTVIYTLKSESPLIKFWLSRPIAPHEQIFFSRSVIGPNQA
ncbi:hypothetical protein HanIR_Chr05g0232021 [Helianthus annuus]|nr:hypothetical protein HanIR_Chr05g0232021 [Helianthus annuus]